jgi:hypothetical protein
MVMAAVLTKACSSCREPHLFFLPIGNAAEPTRQYEFTCPKNRTRVRFQPEKHDPWRRVDSKQPGSIIVREVIAHG